MRSDESILESNGWEIECESPFEIRHEDGSFATGQAAHMVLSSLKDEELLDKYEIMIDRYSDEEVVSLMWESFQRGYHIGRESNNITSIKQVDYIKRRWEGEIHKILDIMNQKPVGMYE
jgi:hypothetical protein